MTATIHHGNCLDVLRDMPDNSVDAIVTDPPYGLSNTTPDKVADTIVAWASGDREHVPTGKGFMGASWDAFVPPPAVWDECYRVLKPGGHLAVFAGSRTQDLMGLSIRLAGFDLRDSLAWLYGSGFPKSLDVSKALDKHAEGDMRRAKLAHFVADRGVDGKWLQAQGVAGASSFHDWTTQGHIPSDRNWAKIRDALGVTPEEEAEFEREVTGTRRRAATGRMMQGQGGYAFGEDFDETAPATDLAKRYEGFGTSLKPAHEPILLARKPIQGTVAANVQEWGTGAINIDATRIGTTDNTTRPTTGGAFLKDGFSTMAELEAAAERGEKTPYGRDARATLARARANEGRTDGGHAQGRFPANVVLDEHQAQVLDQQSGNRPGFASQTDRGTQDGVSTVYGDGVGKINPGRREGYNDEGGASRFFYCAKASKRERPNVDGVQHPTVKPVALMTWLVKLLTPPGGTVLDPFAGSGTTVEAAILEGFHPTGIEAHGPYIPLIQARIDRATPPEPEGDLLGLLGDAA